MDVIAIRLGLTATISTLGFVSIALGEIRVLQAGSVTLAAVSCLGLAAIQRNRVWLLAGFFFAALSLNVMTYWLGSSDPDWRIATDGSFLFAVLFGGATMWLGSRPFVSAPQFRRPTRAAMTGAMLMLPSATLLDARLASGDDGRLLLICAATIGVAGLALMIFAGTHVAHVARSIGRTAEAIFIVGVIVYGTIHILGMTLGSIPVIAAGLSILSTITLVGVTMPDAYKLGTSLHPSSPLFEVQLWPIVLGSLAMGAAHTALRIDLADGSVGVPTLATIGIGVGAMLFAAREIGGPNKPLVLPFGTRDRALQKLPSALLDGRVRLVGQPVQRTTDSKVIGIEARPTWPVAHKPGGPPIDVVAAEAGLAPFLDSITLNLAQAHLPAVLAGLDSDEPWLSVPLHVNTKAAGELPAHGKVDGLVLRIPNAEIGQAIDALRDHGAQLQAPVDMATELDPEIVAVGTTNERLTDVSLRLARASEVGTRPLTARVNLVVDDSKPPTNLAAILSPIHHVDGEDVRRVDPLPD